MDRRIFLPSSDFLNAIKQFTTEYYGTQSGSDEMLHRIDVKGMAMISLILQEYMRYRVLAQESCNPTLEEHIIEQAKWVSRILNLELMHE